MDNKKQINDTSVVPNNKAIILNNFIQFQNIQLTVTNFNKIMHIFKVDEVMDPYIFYSSIPICYKNHWSVLINRNRNKITHFDSTGNHLIDDTSDFIFKKLNIQYTNINKYNLSCQYSDFCCGYFVIYIILSLMLNDSIQVLKDNEVLELLKNKIINLYNEDSDRIIKIICEKYV